MAQIPTFVSTQGYGEGVAQGGTIPIGLAGQVGNTLAEGFERASTQFAQVSSQLREQQSAADASKLFTEGATTLADMRLKYEQDPDPATAGKRFQSDATALQKSLLEQTNDPRVKAMVSRQFAGHAVSEYVGLSRHSAVRLNNDQNASLMVDIGQTASLIANTNNPATRELLLSDMGAKIKARVVSGGLPPGAALQMESNALQQAVTEIAVKPGGVVAANALFQSVKGRMTPGDVMAVSNMLHAPLIGAKADSWVGQRMGRLVPGGGQEPIDPQGRAKQAFDFFVGKGYSPAAAAGVLAQIQHESNFDDKASHDGNTGYGIVGWRGDRLKALQAQYGNAPTYEQQLEFLHQELSGGGDVGAKQAGEIIRRKDIPPEQAGADLSSIAIRPKDVEGNRAARADTARRYYQKYGGTSGGDGAPASPPPDYGLRPDGTKKGSGFLGPIKRPDGRISTEISVGVEIGGKEIDIPTMVPGLTKEQIDQLMKIDNAKDIPPDILNKAIEHAEGRIAAGKSVFASNDESPASTRHSSGGNGTTASPPPPTGAPQGRSDWAAMEQDARQQFANEPEVMRAVIGRIHQERSLSDSLLADERGKMKRGLGGLNAALLDGQNVPIPEREIRALFPVDEAEETIHSLQISQRAGVVTKNVPFASLEQLAELRKSVVPDSSDLATYAQQQQVENRVLAKIKERLEQIGADPVAYTMKSPVMAPYVAALKNGKTQDGQNPVEQLMYASLAEQARLGVPKSERRVLSMQQVGDLVSKITTADPAKGKMVEGLQEQAAQYGQFWPQVYTQLVKDGNLPKGFQILANMDTEKQRQGAANFQNAMAIGPKEMEQHLGFKKQKIEDAVMANIGEFRGAMAGNGSNSAHTLYTAYADAMNLQAMYYVYKNNMQPEQAAAQAYQDMIGAKWDFHGTMMVPKGEGNKIIPSARAAQAALSPGILEQVPKTAATAHLTDAARQDAWTSAAQRGEWVPNPDGTGLRLTVKTDVDGRLGVRLANGEPVEILFNALPQVKPTRPPRTSLQPAFQKIEENAATMGERGIIPTMVGR